ncbi:MAG: HlyC/CorC family transporter [Chloroflexi bacterium]|nr:HlyC/CorC family transporter [Chloroflexota bacterium]MCI0853353.1 HlyC/CorC family transporter [Chloroflexota bacterium]MCI0861143.1 HlyC/CorC family transporter [Chloroflexota bacterium]
MVILLRVVLLVAAADHQGAARNNWSMELAMMEEILLEVSLILILILVNGFFAAAEISVVSSSRSRLQAMAAADHSGARRVLALRGDPGRFLSTVQIGITLVGTLASAIGGASVVRFLEFRLAAMSLPWPSAYTELGALLLVVVVISYFSLVLGELVPKELALRRPIDLAIRLSVPIARLSRLVHPLVWTLVKSSGLILKLFPRWKESEERVTDEEVLALLREGVAAGAFHPTEQTLVQGIFRFADKRVQEIMLPRTSIAAVPADSNLTQILELARQRGYSRYPVYEDDIDQIVGVAHVKDLLRNDDLQRPVREVAREPLLVPGSLRLIEMLHRFQRAGSHLAIVLDKYGGTAGLVTLEDLMEEIVGSIEDEYPHPEPKLERYPDDVLIVPGTLSINDLGVALGLNLPVKLPYDTVAGFMLHFLGYIPHPGDKIDYGKFQFMVQEMDARRIKRVRIAPLADGEHPGGPGQAV